MPHPMQRGGIFMKYDVYDQEGDFIKSIDKEHGNEVQYFRERGYDIIPRSD